MTGFEPATTRPPDAYSNRAELHPALFSDAKVVLFCEKTTIVAKIFSICINEALISGIFFVEWWLKTAGLNFFLC